MISSHILSEIQLLADDIGIIDHGVLLEESSLSELEKKNRKYILLQVSDVPKAALILERQFQQKIILYRTIIPCVFMIPLWTWGRSTKNLWYRM